MKRIDKYKIMDRMPGKSTQVFIIAEAGVNHNGSIDLAKRLINVAAEAGADAVKFQTFVAEDILIPDAPKAEYQKKTTGSLESQFEMIKKLELSKEDHSELMDYAARNNIMFLSTPFDEKSVDLLVEAGVKMIKISSGDITNHPFLKYTAKKNLPIILSTGMSTLDEVREAVRVIKEAGCIDLSLLHCTSNYPAMIEDCNLLAIRTLAGEFQLPVGYSDHTTGIIVPIAAVALGACVIEKHFTLDKNLSGPDHKASIDPDELKEMVRSIREVEIALGSPVKAPVRAELEVRDIARRSIVANVDIPKGSLITEKMLAFKRPGTGLSPMKANLIIGKTMKRTISKNEMIKIEYLQ